MHVILQGSDVNNDDVPFEVSIPLQRAMDERSKVLLAYEMNEIPLSRDHGFPLRVIAPGLAGARSVKWLSRIIISDEESQSKYHKYIYKGCEPTEDIDKINWSLMEPIQPMPVTSAICEPIEYTEVKLNDSCLNLKGYAWSGDGHKIARVDLSVDQGTNWVLAELDHQNLVDGREYGWTLWTACIPLPEAKAGDEVEIWAKAVDSSYNVQPESFLNIWNFQGILANAYHRVIVKIS